MKVAETQRNNLNFSKLFEPYVIDIQSHGHRLFTKHVPQLNLDTYLVHGNNGGTYVNSNLMRDQMDGIIHFLHALGFNEKDYSDTGAARTVIGSLSKFAASSNNPIFRTLFTLVPDYELDYVPQFLVPFEFLPKALRTWYDRDCSVLSKELKDKIRLQGGVIVAKSLGDYHEEMGVTWRISVNHKDIFPEINYLGCNIIAVLITLKDLIKAELSQFSKADLCSYFIKNVLLWCIEERKELREEQLLDFALEKLSLCYSRHKLPYFFGEDCNLIEHVKPRIAYDISTQLDRIRCDREIILARCKNEYNTLEQKTKDKIKQLGFFKIQILRLSVKLTKVCPCITTFFVSKFVRRYLIEAQYEEQVIDDILSRNKSPKLYFLCDKFVLAISNFILRKF